MTAHSLQPTPTPPPSPAVFIDKNSALLHNAPYNVDPAQLRFTPHAVEGLRVLAEAGHPLVVVAHEPGIALHFFDRAALSRLQLALQAELASQGITLAGLYTCPHAAGAPGSVGCLCRKPAPGLLHQAARALNIDLTRSWLVGGLLDDVEAGRRASCRTVLLNTGCESQWRVSPMRMPHQRCGDLLEAAQHILSAMQASTSHLTPELL